MLNLLHKNLLVLLTTMYFCHESLSIYLEGELYTRENWAFLARFCFLPNIGRLTFHIEYEQIYAVQNLLLYYDTPDQWLSAYRDGLTCHQREAFANESNIIKLYYYPCSIMKRVRRGDLITCNYSTNFTTARRRWWYIAVSHCNSSVGLHVKYKFQMTNGKHGDFWHEHFSADELYILPILLSFFVAYLFLLVVVGFCTVELKSRRLLHTTYKMFVVSVILQEAGITIQTIVYVKHAMNGKGISRMRTLGRFLESTSETLFLLLLLLLAKGYTVTRGRLRLSSTVKLTVFMCVYSVAYLIIFIYERLFFDPGKVLYLYESPPGYGLIFLRILAWWLFVYSIVFTLKHYPEKGLFYYPFNILGSLWFIAGPAFILAANGLIDNWVRESVVYGVLHFISLCGHLQFLFLTLPTTANKIFPYRVRTSQVEVMQESDPHSMLPFSHHTYEPSNAFPQDLIITPNRLQLGPQPVQADWTTSVPVELFSVSRVVDSRIDTIIPLKPQGQLLVNGGSQNISNSLHSEEEDVCQMRR